MGASLTVSERAAGRVARLTLDRPGKANAIDSAMLDGVELALAALAGDEELRAVVVTGAGERAFSAGADLELLAAHTPQSARAFAAALHRANRALRELPVPVIARVNGHCLGAGLEMAASCDLRVAAGNATFGMPEVRVGVPSVIEAALLPRLIGWGRTSLLLLTGESIGAEDALRWGLVEAVVPAETLDVRVEQWVSSILSAGPLAIRAQKRLMREWEVLPLGAAVARGIDYFADAYLSSEPRDFIAKLRRPTP